MNLGLSEMIFIFLLALIIFGPKKLPEIGRQIGKFMAEFKRASNEFKAQIETEMRQLELEDMKKQGQPTILPPENTVASHPTVLPDAPTLPAEPTASEPVTTVKAADA